jgi:hypothetical protein
MIFIPGPFGRIYRFELISGSSPAVGPGTPARPAGGSQSKVTPILRVLERLDRPDRPLLDSRPMRPFPLPGITKRDIEAERLLAALAFRVFPDLYTADMARPMATSASRLAGYGHVSEIGLTGGQSERCYRSPSNQDASMRYVVHAQQHCEPIEFAFSTAADAVAKAWRMMGSGATGLYIFDNDSYETFFPGEFVGLFSTMAAVSQARGRKVDRIA